MGREDPWPATCSRSCKLQAKHSSHRPEHPPPLLTEEFSGTEKGRNLPLASNGQGVELELAPLWVRLQVGFVSHYACRSSHLSFLPVHGV